MHLSLSTPGPRRPASVFAPPAAPVATPLPEPAPEPLPDPTPDPTPEPAAVPLLPPAAALPAQPARAAGQQRHPVGWLLLALTLVLAGWLTSSVWRWWFVAVPTVGPRPEPPPVVEPEL